MWSLIRNSTKFIRLTNFPLRPTSSTFCTQTNGPNFEVITKGDSELEHKLKVLVLEVDVMRQEGRLVPDEQYINDKHWSKLLELPTYSSRKRFLEYLFKLSKTKENRQFKKEERQQERAETKPQKVVAETLEEFASNYGLLHNNIFLRIYETTMNNLYNNRLIQAMQFGQKLVIDCGYDQNMTPRENINCAKQIMLLFAENRVHQDPFDLHLCNLNYESQLMKSLYGHIPTLHEPWFPLNLHKSSYLDQFPKEQLVYLTPHCREEIREYDHDAIYIIGAIVDKVNNEPLSLAKAKREGIKMAKLPLDKYLQWGAGSGKSLTLNQVTSILLDAKSTGNWQHALRHVPRRKIIETTPEIIQQKRTWKPATSINLSNLSYRGDKKEKRLNIKSLYND